MAKKNGSAPTPAPRAELVFIRAGDLVAWPNLNPRRRFDEDKLAELAASIEKQGVLEPILVHERTDADTFDLPSRFPAKQKHLIVAGERRWRAASQVSPDTMVPCMVRRFTLEEALEIALIENLERSDLSPIEEAIGFAELLKLPGATQGALAARLGRSQPYISNRVRLLELSSNVLTLVEEGSIDVSAARDLLLPFTRIPPEKQAKLFPAVVAAVRKQADGAKGDSPLDARVLTQLVAGVAAKLSRPVDHMAFIWSIDSNDSRALFDESEHAACGCGGPRFQYGYGQGVRCFDEAWWDGAQNAAREKIEAERARNAERHADGSRGSELVLLRGRKFDDLPSFHPADLPVEALEVRVIDGVGCVVCTNMDALEAAETAFISRLTAGAEAATQGETNALLARAAAAKLEPWMLVAAAAGRFNANPDVLDQVAKRLGIDVASAAKADGESVTATAAHNLFKAAALMPPRDWQAGHRRQREAEQKLQAEARTLLRAMIDEPPHDGLPDAALTQLRELLGAGADLIDDAEWDGVDDDLIARMRTWLDQWKAFTAKHRKYRPSDEDRAIVDDVAQQVEAWTEEAAA